MENVATLAFPISLGSLISDDKLSTASRASIPQQSFHRKLRHHDAQKLRDVITY